MNTTHKQTLTLKDFRINKGLTQAMVADIVGISVSHYCNIENRNRGINYQIAKRLSACLSVSIENIYKYSGY